MLPLSVQALLAFLTISGLCALTIRHPKRAVMLLLILVPLYDVRFSFGPLPTSLLELGIGGFLLGALFLLWKKKSLQTIASWRQLPTTVWIFGALTLWAGISIFWTIDPMHGLGLWRAFYFEPLLVFIVLALMVREKIVAREDVVRGVLWAAIIPLSIGVAQLFGWGTIDPWHIDGPDFRVTSVFVQPNMVSLFLAPIIAVVFFSRYRVLAKVFIILGLFAIILASRSDGGLAAALVGLFGMVLLHIIRRPRWVKGILVILLAGSIIYPFIVRSLTERLPFDFGPSHIVRRDLIDVSLQYLRTHLFLGTGMGNFATTTPVWIPYVSGYPAPHTLLLNVTTELGLVGGVLFYGLAIGAVWSGMRSSRGDLQPDLQLYPLIGAWMIVIMVIHSVVDVSFFKNDLAILFVVALLFTWRSQSGTLATHGADVRTSGN